MAVCILGVLVLIKLEEKNTLVIENLTRHSKITHNIDLNQIMEISYIHSLYGGLQVEVYKLTPQNDLKLEMMKFENFDALMYYFSGDVKDEYYEEPFWIMTSEYRTKRVRFIIPLIKDNYLNFMIKINDRVIKADEIGHPGDMINIYILKTRSTAVRTFMSRISVSRNST